MLLCLFFEKHYKYTTHSCRFLILNIHSTAAVMFWKQKEHKKLYKVGRKCEVYLHFVCTYKQLLNQASKCQPVWSVCVVNEADYSWVSRKYTQHSFDWLIYGSPLYSWDMLHSYTNTHNHEDCHLDWMSCNRCAIP